MARGRPRKFDLDEALNTALNLFWRHGYEGTSIAALAEAMGINVPSLYAAFGGKEELFQKTVDHYIKNPASYLPEALREPTAERVIEKLLLGAIAMVSNPQHPNGCLLVHGALASSPLAEPIQKELVRRRSKAEAVVRQRFERSASEGDLPKDLDPASLAHFVMTTIWGLSVQASGGATRRQLEASARMAMKCLSFKPRTLEGVRK